MGPIEFILGMGHTGWPASSQKGHTNRWMWPLDKPTKKCAYCGKPHIHNNSYCCADHCKKHRSGIPYVEEK